MTRHVNQDFLRGDPGSQNRTLRTVGIGVAAASAVVLGLASVVVPRVTAPDGTEITVVVPSLGTGLKAGSTVMLRGAEIGEVTEVDASDRRSVTMHLVIDSGEEGKLTDGFTVDFRPANYFGSTSVNVQAGDGAETIRDGGVYRRTVASDYSMSTMIREVSTVVDGTLTSSIVDTLDKVMEYADGLAPLIRSGVIVADAVARTQQRMPTELLAKANAVFGEFGDFNIGAMTGLYSLFDTVYNQRGSDGQRVIDRHRLGLIDGGLEVAGTDLFTKIGWLLSSHETDLLPLVTSAKLMSDPVPDLVDDVTMDRLISLLTGVRGAFTGPPGSPRLKVDVAPKGGR